MKIISRKKRKSLNNQNYSQDVLKEGTAVIKDWIQNWDKYANKLTNNILNTYNGMNTFNNLYAPLLGQDYTKSIASSTSIPDQATLLDWIKYPENHESQLRGVSNYLSNVIQQYDRTIDYFANALLFRYDLRALNSPKSSTDTAQWKSGYSRCNNFLRDFNLTYQLPVVIKKVLKEGGYFGYLREGGNFATLIEIPTDYCIITGKWDLGWRFAIDLSFFDKMVGMEKSIPEVYEYYKQFVDIRNKMFNGTLKISEEELIEYQYFKVPIDKGFCITFDPLRAQVVPPFIGLFRDALGIIEYKDLLKAKTQLDTFKMIAQEIPRDKDNQPAIPEPIVSKFIAKAQSVMPTGAVTFATPMTVRELSFNNTQSQNTIIGLGTSEYFNTAGINGAVLDGIGQTAPAIEVSVINDFGYVEHLYRDCENFINFQLYLKSKLMRFRVKLYGNKYTELKDVKTYSELVSKINMPVGKMFGMIGFEPFEIDSILDMEKMLNWKEKLDPILSAFNTKGLSDSENKGTPEKDSLTDGGQKTKDYDSNATSGKV